MENPMEDAMENPRENPMDFSNASVIRLLNSQETSPPQGCGNLECRAAGYCALHPPYSVSPEGAWDGDCRFTAQEVLHQQPDCRHHCKD